MDNLVRRFFLGVVVFTVAFAAYGQPGGFRGGGIFGSRTDPLRETSLAGNWTMEFVVAYDSEDPEAVGERRSLRVDITVAGIEVVGQFRHPARGEFTCSVYQGSDRCESGRLVIVWPDEEHTEAATFEFAVDQSDLRRAKGEAHFTSGEHAGTRQYTVNMTKR